MEITNPGNGIHTDNPRNQSGATEISVHNKSDIQKPGHANYNCEQRIRLKRSKVHVQFHQITSKYHYHLADIIKNNSL